MKKETVEYNFKHIELFRYLKFKYIAHHTNFNILTNTDHFLTDYTGDVIKLRFMENKPPLIIGDFSFSVWNFDLANKMNINVFDTFLDYPSNHPYSEIHTIYKTNPNLFYKIKKMVLIHTLILHPDYRGKNISEEFVEFIYRAFYDEDNLILLNATPLQYNEEDFLYFNIYKTIELKNDIHDDDNILKIKAKEYYNLDDLSKDDLEIDTYKVYGIAARCGFNRLSDTSIFKLEDYKILNRILYKQKKFGI